MEKYDKNELDISRLNNKVTSLEISLNKLKREKKDSELEAEIKLMKELITEQRSLIKTLVETQDMTTKSLENLLDGMKAFKEFKQSVEISLDETYEQNANYGIMWSAISEIQETIAKDKGEPVSFVFTRRVL